MRKILVLIFIFCIYMSYSYAQIEESKNTNTEAAPAVEVKPTPTSHIAPPKIISGEVTKIDTTNPEVAILTVKDVNGEETNIEVNPNLSITKIISPTDLQKGDNIRITYEQKDDKRIARNIFLGRPNPIRTEPTP